MHTIAKIEYTIIEDGMCFVKAEVEDIRLACLSTYWAPAEYENAMCLLSFPIEPDDDDFPVHDLTGNDMIDYLEKIKDPQWILVEDDNY
jgi:hypothetical protein